VRWSGYAKRQNKDKEMRFTALFHHIYAPAALRTAYLCLKRESRGPAWTVRRGGTTARRLRINLQKPLP